MERSRWTIHYLRLHFPYKLQSTLLFSHIGMSPFSSRFLTKILIALPALPFAICSIYFNHPLRTLLNSPLFLPSMSSSPSSSAPDISAVKQVAAAAISEQEATARIVNTYKAMRAKISELVIQIMHFFLIQGVHFFKCMLIMMFAY